jgi:flavin reductase (DIM6/NTAB) family NADH-FMN oxidoreductase RutF
MFKEINIEELNMNPFTKIGDEWALLTAGDEKSGFNMMTASWAGFGMFWARNTITVYIRESRYTRSFFEKNELFTVSFYDKEYRRALDICGQLHGNECDKTKESGLAPYFTDGTTAFEEASLIFVCRKLIHADLTRETADAADVFDSVYREPDLHRMYIGEIIKVLAR